MPCFLDGKPVVSPASLAHFPLTSVTVAGLTETIAINWVATKHVKMEQMVAHWNAIPTASEELVLRKLSVTSPSIDTVLRAVDPSLTASGGENLTDLSCVIPFYWRIGDTVQITYLNTDDQDVGVEIMLVEVP